MAKLPKPYLSKSMNNIVVLSLGLIAVFFLYRYIKSLENDVVKLRSDLQKIEESATDRATCVKPTGSESAAACPVARTREFVPAPTEFETNASYEDHDSESIKSEDLTAMLRAVLVNEGMACVDQEDDDDTVEVCEAEEAPEEAPEEDTEEAPEEAPEEATEEATEEVPEEATQELEEIHSDASNELSTEEVRELLSGKTCEQLRTLLKERGVDNLKGKKSDLVERILSC
jgi:hypothetical protein